VRWPLRALLAGDEGVQVQVSKSGLVNQPFTITVDNRSLTFDGFCISMNDKSRDGWQVREVESRLDGNRVIVHQTLQHPELEAPTSARFEVWMQPGDKAIRFKMAFEGEGQDPSYLRLGRCHGQNLQVKRMCYGLPSVGRFPSGGNFPI